MELAFDPTTYLFSLDPDVSYSATKLTGGFINLTFRATKTSGNNGKGRFPNYPSLIIKYATPYVAAIGKDAPMTLTRQSIEARALSLFHGGPLQERCERSGVTVPELLHHDSEAHVLIISDLGLLPDLSQVFSDLGGIVDNPKINTTGAKVEKTSAFPEVTDHQLFKELGQRLGKFFAGLHSAETKEQVLSKYSKDHYDNPDMRHGVLEHAIKPVADYLKLFSDLLSAEEAEHLRSIIVEDFQRKNLEEEQSFVIGDCWPGAILAGSNKECGVIDWEFAGFGRGPHGDMAQLLAHLELLCIAAGQDTGEHFGRETTCIRWLLLSLIDSYRSTADMHEKQNTTNDTDLTMKRSAFLSHGAEMVNCAFWKRWPCLSSDCQGKIDHKAEVHKCVVVRQMVEQGLWFLRHAGENTAAFDTTENWKAIEAQRQKITANGRNGWLLDIFPPSRSQDLV